jgi:hypothetical protein
MKTVAPGFRRLASAGWNVTIGASGPTTISDSPPLYASFSVRPVGAAAMPATAALVIKLSGWRSHGN